MKKILLITISALLMLGLAACSPKNMMEQMIEQEAEKQGEDVDVEISGDSMTISGEDGSVNIQQGEGMAWPGDKLPASVPQVTGVTVTQIIDAGTGVMIYFEGCSQATADAYIEQLKSINWEASYESRTEEGYMVIFGDNQESLSFTWTKDDNAGSVTYGKNE